MTRGNKAGGGAGRRTSRKGIEQTGEGVGRGSIAAEQGGSKRHQVVLLWKISSFRVAPLQGGQRTANEARGSSGRAGVWALAQSGSVRRHGWYS